MTVRVAYCPSCGKPLPQQATNFCPSCGARITTLPSQTQQALPPGFLPPATAPAPPVSTGVYKAIIGILLVIIILLGVGLYATALNGHLFSLGSYRYQLTNPPNYQSIQPPNTPNPPPQTTTWNSCGGSPSSGCNVSARGWREGTIPDTYDYFVSFTSTVPITVYFFTLGQFVQFTVCNGDVSCVSGYYDHLSAATSQQGSRFKLAEGCGDYVSVFVASGTGVMYPNVAVTNNPAPYPTGYCAQVGGGGG